MLDSNGRFSENQRKSKVSGPFSRLVFGVLGGPPARSQGALQAKTLGHAFRPSLQPVRLPTLHAAPQRLQFRPAVRTLDLRQPVRRLGERPVAEEPRLGLLGLRAARGCTSATLRPGAPSR